MRIILFLIALSIGALFALAGLAGCDHDHLPPATQQQIDQLHQQTAIVKSQDKLATARANANPPAHPIKSTAIEIRKVRTPLEWFFVAGMVTLGAAAGLAFTPLSSLSKILLPLAGGVTVVSIAGVIVLPWLPWILLAAGVALVGLLIYEIVRYGGIKSVAAKATAEAEQLAAQIPVHVLGTQPPPAPPAAPRAA